MNYYEFTFAEDYGCLESQDVLAFYPLTYPSQNFVYCLLPRTRLAGSPHSILKEPRSATQKYKPLYDDYSTKMYVICTEPVLFGEAALSRTPLQILKVLDSGLEFLLMWHSNDTFISIFELQLQSCSIHMEDGCNLRASLLRLLFLYVYRSRNLNWWTMQDANNFGWNTRLHGQVLKGCDVLVQSPSTKYRARWKIYMTKTDRDTWFLLSRELRLHSHNLALAHVVLRLPYFDFMKLIS